MYTTHQTQALSYGREFDPVRKSPRLRVLVDVSPRSTNFPLAHEGCTSYRIPQGRSEQIIYEDDLPALLAKVEESADALYSAQESYQLRLAEHLREQMKFDPGPREDWATKLTPAQHSMALRLAREFEATTNPEAIFRDNKRRSVKPFKSVTVLEKLPPLQTETETDAIANVELLAKALAKALSGANAEMLSQVSELIAGASKKSSK